MRQVFLPHYEELEVGTEEHQFEALRVLLAVIFDDPVKYVDDDHEADVPKIQDVQPVAALLNNLLGFLREQTHVIGLALPLSHQGRGNELLGLEQRIDDPAHERFLFLLHPVLFLLCLGRATPGGLPLNRLLGSIGEQLLA